MSEAPVRETGINKSTIVRSSSATWRRSVRERAVRASFRALERAAPGLGSLWAERLWLTVRHADRSRSAPAAPGGVVTIPLRATGDGPAFVAEVWGDSGPVVYLIHGWGGHRGQFAGFVAPLAAAGFRVVAIDAPSHGDSGPGSFGPKRALITEFIAALHAAPRVFGPAHAIVGHSLGGGAAATAALDGLPAGRLVLISPMPDAGAYLHGFAAALGAGDRIRAGLERRLERRAGRPLSMFDAAARARAAHDAALPPLLVIHDEHDRQVPYSLGRSVAAAWRGARLVATNGLGHNRILRDPGVIRTALDFVGAATAATPR
ncbi:alpha/beta fold hydrolase [Actinocrinis puniceicyclus]|uniref:Alpha/beta fold hydrolase n=1 Tax=Actinocrinis puniceicyclus TaxID=977794 RepID=A0A8J7WNX3_9ACTN|nr:alpha/beta hydrolase family protein [Actinocrinis puniceicyclus]MBS2963197.1 alpha/beta fold hydrolase [Actinocrinis puniceicyclus]